MRSPYVNLCSLSVAAIVLTKRMPLVLNSEDSPDSFIMCLTDL